MSERTELGKVIFEWFDRTEPSYEGDTMDPYTYNADPEVLQIGVDGVLECRLLADALLKAGYRRLA